MPTSPRSAAPVTVDADQNAAQVQRVQSLAGVLTILPAGLAQLRAQPSLVTVMLALVGCCDLRSVASLLCHFLDASDQHSEICEDNEERLRQAAMKFMHAFPSSDGESHFRMAQVAGPEPDVRLLVRILVAVTEQRAAHESEAA
jgi:hypothetical protein